ncbi:Isopenicillin N synthase-like [Phytophthora cactorum]|nr:Isopenicillin N synthase-like [Phytophthora cactorum]
MDVRQVPVIGIGALMGLSSDAEVDDALRGAKQELLHRNDRQPHQKQTDWKECFDFAGADEDSPPTDKIERLDEDQNQWLDEVTLPGFRNEMQLYYKKMERIARRLLKVFAVALGEKPAVFDKFYDGNHSSILRLNHYPMAPEPEKTMGVYHHTDFGALTILLQDGEVASLQVLHRDSQTWVNVPPARARTLSM